jgi:hypothetical protein
MIRVIVGNEQSIHVTNIPTATFETAGRLAPADPGVEQQAHAIRFHVDGISIRTGLEGERQHPSGCPVHRLAPHPL